MKNIVWKIVYCSPPEQIYQSTFSPYPVKYEIGKTTYPLPGTKLFAFRTKRKAIAWIKCSSDDYHVFRCEAEVTKGTRHIWLGTRLFLGTVQDIFSSPDRKKYNRDETVICCDSITPRKLVK